MIIDVGNHDDDDDNIDDDDVDDNDGNYSVTYKVNEASMNII